MKFRTSTAKTASVDGRLPQIQSFRGLAVLSVFVYHLDSSFLPGGYLGVDIFFVISGFVITKSLLRRNPSSFRIAEFLARRFWRLFPTLALVVLTTIALTLVWVPPSKFTETASATGVAALLGVANLQIQILSGDYFGPAAHQNVFLHTWSLSLEEQFYFGFSIVLFAFFRFLKQRNSHRDSLRAIVSTLLLISLSAYIMGTHLSLSPASAAILGFYSPVSRAWEFLAGSLAFLFSSDLRGLHGTLLRIFMWPAVAFSVLFFSPALLADNPLLLMVPVASAVVILVDSAQKAKLSANAGKFDAALGWLGDRSYSIYLWHWPVILLLDQLTVDLNGVFMAVGITLTLSHISFKYVETAFRERFTRGRQSIAALVLVLATVAPVATVSANSSTIDELLVSSGLFQERFTQSIKNEDFMSMLAQFKVCENLRVQGLSPSSDGVLRCRQSESGHLDTIVIGDSHAEHLFPGLALEREFGNVAYWILAEPPVFGHSPDMDTLLQEAITSDAKNVVIGAHWSYREVKWSEVLEVVDALEGVGKRALVVVGSPQFSYEPAWCKYSASLVQRTGTCSEDIESAIEQEKLKSSGPIYPIGSIQTGESGVLDISGLFCSKNTCSMLNEDSGQLLFRDENHLNREGSLYVALTLAELLLERQQTR